MDVVLYTNHVPSFLPALLNPNHIPTHEETEATHRGREDMQAGQILSVGKKGGH